MGYSTGAVSALLAGRSGPSFLLAFGPCNHGSNLPAPNVRDEGLSAVNLTTVQRLGNAVGILRAIIHRCRTGSCCNNNNNNKDSKRNRSSSCHDWYKDNP